MANERYDGPRAPLSIAQWLALATSLVFIVVGVAGFFVTGFNDFASHDTMKELLIFEVNPLHNIVHLVLGLIGLALFRQVLLASASIPGFFPPVPSESIVRRSVRSPIGGGFARTTIVTLSRAGTIVSPRAISRPSLCSTHRE